MFIIIFDNHNYFKNLAAVTDIMVDDIGELYDEEKEGGDKRNIDLNAGVKRHVENIVLSNNIEQKETVLKRIKVDANANE